MCDTVKRSSCLRSTGKKIGPVKLSKWELPIPSSKSYWDGVCAEIEKKHKRVRDAYPSLSPLSVPSSAVATTTAVSRTQFHDDFKFKISPPTPMHKIQQSSIVAAPPPPPPIDSESDRILSVDNANLISQDDKFQDEVVELPPTTSTEAVKVLKKGRHKIFSKKTCPFHKNASEIKIFDDEIVKYLKTVEKKVTTLPKIVAEKKVIHEQPEVPRSKSTSASSTRSRETQKSFKEVLQERRVSKAPKLGMASLLPSFARPVSTDSSAGTRSSFESEEELPKVQSQSDLNTTTRDFLRVPNLSFVSSHPSFRKLSFVDSVDDDEGGDESVSGMSEMDFLFVEKEEMRAEENVEEIKEIDKDGKKKKKNKEKKMLMNMPDLEKEYAYKALDVITKKSHVNVRRNSDDSSEKSSIVSEVSSIPDIPKFKKMMRSLDKESSIDFREVRQKLKRLVSQSRDKKSMSLDSEKAESRTIYSASRSTSSSSPDFESKAIEVQKTDVLEKIPDTKVFQRAYIDKCHACLFKPFKTERKVIRELPLATLVSVVKSPTKFRVTSSSGSSTTEEVPISTIYKYEDDMFDFPELQEMDFPEEIYKPKDAKDHPRVSFDQSNLAKTEQRERSQSPKSDYHLKERSFSVQSSDRSKTSTPSNQSSESDDARGPQDGDKLPSSKFMAPCHAPVVLRKSLEPYRGLKQKKFMSLRARAAAITAKSSDGSESESQEEDVEAKIPEETTVEQEEKEEKKEKKKKKKKKKLVRMKSVVEKMTEFSSSMDVRDVKDKKLLKRAKTTFDLLDGSDESKSEETSEEEEEARVETKEPEIDKKEEQLPLADAIVMHRPASPASPVMSTHDVIDIVKACLQEDFTPANLLNRLNDEFIKRMNERYERLKDSEDAKYLKLGLDLFNALIHSRRYLKPYSFDPNLKFSHKQPPLTNSRQLRRILPPQSYQLVAPILGMPKYAASVEDDDESLSSASTKTELSFDLVVHPPTPRDNERSQETRGVNPYSLFLRKPRRKVVVWRPLREEDLKGYDPEATLEMRATRLMDRICKEFCDWVRQLGEQVIDEETLKDMFEINFTSDACKSMQVVIKEMPTVPLPVVKARLCPEANELEATRKQMRQDLKVEARAKRTFAFGRALPRELRFVPPRTRIANKWLDCEYIPKDLQKMDVVWDDIGTLDSVQEFYNFLKSKKVLRSAKLLKNLDEVVNAKV